MTKIIDKNPVNLPKYILDKEFNKVENKVFSIVSTYDSTNAVKVFNHARSLHKTEQRNQYLVIVNNINVKLIDQSVVAIPDFDKLAQKLINDSTAFLSIVRKPSLNSFNNIVNNTLSIDNFTQNDITETIVSEFLLKQQSKIQNAHSHIYSLKKTYTEGAGGITYEGIFPNFQHYTDFESRSDIIPSQESQPVMNMPIVFNGLEGHIYPNFTNLLNTSLEEIINDNGVGKFPSTYKPLELPVTALDGTFLDGIKVKLMVSIGAEVYERTNK